VGSGALLRLVRRILLWRPMHLFIPLRWSRVTIVELGSGDGIGFALCRLSVYRMIMGIAYGFYILLANLVAFVHLGMRR
jgi:hypothetical protein